MTARKELLKKWRELSVDDLRLELQELTRKQFKLKIQHSSGDLKEIHLIKKIRKNIARVLGLLVEKVH
jgi:large subunit ribosomal protein L29